MIYSLILDVIVDVRFKNNIYLRVKKSSIKCLDPKVVDIDHTIHVIVRHPTGGEVYETFIEKFNRGDFHYEELRDIKEDGYVHQDGCLIFEIYAYEREKENPEFENLEYEHYQIGEKLRRSK